MAEAAEARRRPADRHDPPEVAERPGRRDRRDAGVRKLAGVLGETDGLGDRAIRASSIGIGINADWAAADFPPELAASMTSLREASGGRADRPRAALLDAFLGRLEPRVEALRGGPASTARAWTARQLTTGRTVRLETPAGAETRRARSASTRDTGALVVADPRRSAAASAGSSSARSATSGSTEPLDGGGVTRWPVRHCGEWTVRRRAVRASPTSTATDGWSRRPRRTRPGSRPCIGSTWPRCTATPYYELRDHHDAEDATERDVPRRAGQPRPVRGARPAGRRRGRLDVPRLAVPDRPQRRRRASAGSAAAGPRRRSRPRLTSPRRSTSRPRPSRRDEARRGVAGRRAAARRSPPGGRPALRRRDVDGRDRRRPRSVRGRGPGPHPPRAAERRARPRRPRSR